MAIIQPNGTAPIVLGGGAASPQYQAFFRALVAAIAAVSGGSDTDLSGITINGSNSISVSGSLSSGYVTIKLSGDSSGAGPSYYYGTDTTGTKGWFAITDAFDAGTGLVKLLDGYAILDDLNSTDDLPATGVEGTAYTIDSLLYAWSDGAWTQVEDRTGVVGYRLDELADSGEGAALVKITRDAYGRVSGTEAATTDDLTEGTTNLYFTDARVYAAAKAQLTPGENITITADDAALTLTIAGESGITAFTVLGVLDATTDLPATATTGDAYVIDGHIWVYSSTGEWQDAGAFVGETGATGATGAAGADGSDGAAATITVGTVTTLDAGESATVANSGTEAAAVFNFGIPRGETGETGEQGEQGIQGIQGEIGPAGADGADGLGVPAGGTTGQVLSKVSDTDNDTAWTDPSGGGTWGEITGTLADQADLQEALDAKANTTDLAAVATSGSYDDLSDTPTIPDAQVNSDWDATSGLAQILNKPSLPTSITITAGEAIGAGKFVYIASDGKSYLADYSSADTAASLYVTTAIAADASGSAYQDGANTALSGLTPGAIYALESSGGIALASALTATSGTLLQPLGTALSTTSLAVSIQPAILRG